MKRGSILSVGVQPAPPDADHARWTPPARIAEVIHVPTSRDAYAITGTLIPVTNGG